MESNRAASPIGARTHKNGELAASALAQRTHRHHKFPKA